MGRPEDIARFLEVYTRSWTTTPTRGRIFHPGGGVQYPGEAGRYRPDDQGMRTDQLRSLAPDLRMTLLNWAERDDVLFAEWNLSCTLGGRSLNVLGVNRFHLEGDRAREARAFIDRLELLELAEPGREVLSLEALLRRISGGPIA